MMKKLDHSDPSKKTSCTMDASLYVDFFDAKKYICYSVSELFLQSWNFSSQDLIFGKFLTLGEHVACK